MKRIFIFTLLSVLVVPAFAEDSAIKDESVLKEESIQDAASVKSDKSKDLEIKETNKSEFSNPDVRFPHGLQIGVGLSVTSGLNGFVGYANKNFDSFWLKRFGIRADFATTSPLKSLINSGIDAVMGDEGIDIGDGIIIKDGDIKNQHFAALIDFYPFGNTWFLGGIRLTGGYYWGDLELTAKLTGHVEELPDSEFAFELNGADYRYVGNQLYGTAKADWNYRGPYLGAGFDWGLFAGFKIYMDAGVVFTNKTAQLGLDLPTDNLQKWNGTSWEKVELDGIAEFEQAKQDALADAQDELNKLKFYPMIKIGFMYRF